MRIDKFLKISRILKRRSLGKEACESQRVVVNGKQAKPSYNLKIGDIVEIAFGSGTVKFKVLNIKVEITFSYSVPFISSKTSEKAFGYILFWVTLIFFPILYKNLFVSLILS